MIIKKLIAKIEGEAELDFKMKNGEVEDVHINFGFYRGIEDILVGKAPRDALVITPRVCGICNHAHLISAVRAIEDGYKEAGIKVELTQKAKDIREFTLACELIQNHIKWFYLTILPTLEKLLNKENDENYALKASYFSATVTQALAIFAGQWPHASYAVPGGVTCDPTYVDVLQAQTLIDKAIQFFEQTMTGLTLDTYLSLDSYTMLDQIQGDFGKMLSLIELNGMAELGKSHGRFMVLADSPLGTSGKSISTKVSAINLAYVQESLQHNTQAKAVTYREKLYEVGPLSRAMVNKIPMVKSLHKRYRDSMLTRVFARVHETAILLQKSKELLEELDLNEASCSLGSELLSQNFEGIGVVEAARGSLLHKVSVIEGKIENYEIVVPTQWNLSHGNKKENGIAIKAMIGSKSVEEASFVFRTFDVCSVCTTQ